jgi:hypothetical protein
LHKKDFDLAFIKSTENTVKGGDPKNSKRKKDLEDDEEIDEMGILDTNGDNDYAINA